MNLSILIKNFVKSWLLRKGYRIERVQSEITPQIGSVRGSGSDKNEINKVIYIENTDDLKTVRLIKKYADEHGVRGWVASAKGGGVVCFSSCTLENVHGYLHDLIPIISGAENSSIIDVTHGVKKYAGFTIEDYVIGPEQAYLIVSENSEDAFPDLQASIQKSRRVNYLRWIEFIGSDYCSRESLRKRALQLISADDIHQQQISKPRKWLNCTRREGELFGCSFKSAFVNQIKMTRKIRRHLGHAPTTVLNRKLIGHKFAAIHGLVSPETYYEKIDFDKFKVIYRDIPKPFILKPVSGLGSKGVYAVYSDGRALRIKDKVEMDEDGFFSDIKKKLEDGYVSNSWIVQEYVTYLGSPGHDVKFYTFYGRIVLIRERRTVDGLSCWYNRRGEVVNAGIYKQFKGSLKVSQSTIKKVERASLSIPAPFMRIDLLLGDKGYYFGEFTFLTGNFHNFNSAYNQKLGNELHAANARLYSDFMKGKVFEKYNKFYKENISDASGDVKGKDNVLSPIE